jgi:hypothetical protein
LPIVLDLIPPSQSYQNATADVFDSPKVKGRQQDDKDKYHDKVKSENAIEQIDEERRQLEPHVEEENGPVFGLPSTHTSFIKGHSRSAANSHKGQFKKNSEPR